VRLGLSELMDARATAELPAGARGIIFQLCESLGVLQRRPIEQQLGQLGEEDRKALARLGVRVGVNSLYFPSMLKPVPIRLRAGLWMVSKGRETIPPLPAEGRTSMDLPRDAERDFYAAIGYLPLGDHAIRADMVERLAAMARQAVRDSREAARRAQQEKRAEKPTTTEAAVAPAAAPPADSEISEWAIVAAAFGEAEPAAEPAPTPEPIADTTPVVEEPATLEEPAATIVVEAIPAEAAAVEEAKPEEAKADEPAMEGPAKEEPTKDVLRPLAPGHFRATPQMMSLVGCSEPEMANVLRALGYRVHIPSEETGSLHSFSVKPRFVREREEQRERQRQQEQERRDQRRRERPERPNERQFFADSPQRGEPRRDGVKDGPRRDGPPRDGPRPDRAKDGPREERRGPRPPRRDTGGPALRLYATTEKKGDAAADSPFAKLLELKLGGKK
jgi:ATP-dependent RNA helicase SUPV3L1/SUV3